MVLHRETRIGGSLAARGGLRRGAEDDWRVMRMRVFLTEEDFAARDAKGPREEFKDGVVVELAPESGTSEDLRWFLGRLLLEVVECAGLGKVRGPEFQVRLRPGLRRQPDLLFVAAARLHLVQETWLDGPPDLALEIVSEDSVARDYREKYLEYQTSGVPEYWLVDPLTRNVELHRLVAGGGYEPMPPRDGWLESSVVPGFRLRPEWLWLPALPTLREALQEIGRSGGAA